MTQQQIEQLDAEEYSNFIIDGELDEQPLFKIAECEEVQGLTSRELELLFGACPY